MDKEPLNRFAAARGYLEAIKMICTSPHMNSESRVVYTVLPLNMLAGFALELYFKAWLLLQGEPSRKVRAYGHKVEKLFAEAQSLGLPAVQDLDQLVDAMAAGHEDFTYRYIEEGADVNLVRWELAVPVFDALDEVVHAKIPAPGPTTSSQG